MNNMVVLPYDPEWPTLFIQIKTYLESAMGKYCLSIEHVGSTSIPGMTAKPVIDVDIVIQRGTFESAKSALEELGYFHEGDKGLKGREAFDCNRLEVDLNFHHLYVCEEGNHHLVKHLSFRNYLRKRPELVRQLSEHKVHLAREAGQDRKEYQRKKELSSFLKEVVESAFKSYR